MLLFFAPKRHQQGPHLFSPKNSEGVFFRGPPARLELRSGEKTIPPKKTQVAGEPPKFPHSPGVFQPTSNGLNSTWRLPPCRRSLRPPLRHRRRQLPPRPLGHLAPQALHHVRAVLRGLHQRQATCGRQSVGRVGAPEENGRMACRIEKTSL